MDTRTGSVRSSGCDLYCEMTGSGVPILLIHPSGATASTWGSAIDGLARLGLVVTYDRRGYARSGGEVVRSVSRHASDAAAILDSLRPVRAVVVGTSAGAAIAVDLAVRRPDLVRAVIAHEFPWRMNRHLPTVPQLAAFARMGSFVLRARQADAVEVLLRAAYTYRDGGSAWDAFPEEWRQAARESAKATLRDFVSSIGNYPSASDLGTVRVPVVCSHGSRSPEFMVRLVRSLASAIPTATTEVIDGAAHAAPFDATTKFVRLIGDTIEDGTREEADTMNTYVRETQRSGSWASAMTWWRRRAWLLILIADVGLLLWGAGAALIPERLPGPGGTAILPAGYEGYTGGSWEQLQATSAETAGYIAVVFRLYGVYIVAFSVLAIAIAANSFRRGERWAWWALLVGNALAWPAAMSYDLIVHAIGPFELTEYLGLGIILGSLAVTWCSVHPGAGSEGSVLTT